MYPLRETLTKKFEVNSTNVMESTEQMNEQMNIQTDERKGESYIPLGINAEGIIRPLV